jgi:hypothetical protein
LRGDDARLVARARRRRRGPRVAVSALEDDEREFPVPKIRPTRRRFTTAATRQRVRRKWGYSARSQTAWERAYANCAASLYVREDHETAAELFHLSLEHPHGLVRIASAAAYYPIAADRARLGRVLTVGLGSADDLERSLAATALARISPKSPALRRLTAYRRRPRRQPGTSHTITIIHGTWATNSEWYQPPDGDFFTFVQGQRNDLYDKPDFFSWSGDWSDPERSAGATKLVQWVDDHQEQGLDLIGHSHGANVMLLATTRGLTSGKTILLSCPVHVDKYFPDFSKVTKPIFSVRVKLDLVILVDGGGQKFSHPDITEIVLPTWFDHFASHEPQVWQQHNIAGQVGL